MRDQAADDREAGIDEFAHAAGLAAAARQERSAEAIARTVRDFSERCQARPQRSCSTAREHTCQPEQAETDRESVMSDRELAHQPRDPGQPVVPSPVEHAKALRKQLAATAAELARTEEQVAGVHDELAARDPDKASSYRRVADEARKAAGHGREIARHFSG